MARPDKAAAVAEMKSQFENSDAVVLTEYRGLTVKDLRDLRRSLGENATYAVAKNTLALRAAEEAGIEGLSEQLTGPTAFAYINGDIAAVAKGLRDFAKANPLLVIKGGVMDGRVLDATAVKKLADLESREVLLAKVAGGLKGTLSQAVSLFAAPLSQAARAFGALSSAAQDNPDLIGGAGASADQEPAAAAPAAEDASDATTGTENTTDAAADAASTNE